MKNENFQSWICVTLTIRWWSHENEAVEREVKDTLADSNVNGDKIENMDEF